MCSLFIYVMLERNLWSEELAYSTTWSKQTEDNHPINNLCYIYVLCNAFC